MNIEKIFDLLKKYDTNGGFCLTDRKNPWWGVLVDGFDDRHYYMTTMGTGLAAKLLEYMLSGDVQGETVEGLKEQFARARQSNPGLATNLHGKEVPFDQIQLPQRLV